MTNQDNINVLEKWRMNNKLYLIQPDISKYYDSVKLSTLEQRSLSQHYTYLYVFSYIIMSGI